MKTDIEIAQEAELLPIREVAARLDISEDELELYGTYKAKLTDELLQKHADKPDGKLVLVTAINPTPAGGREDDDEYRAWAGVWADGEKSSACASRAVVRTMLWHQRRRCRRRVCAGGSDGRPESPFYRRFSCDYGGK